MLSENKVGIRMDKDNLFMQEAIHLSALAVKNGNEPFGAVIVKDDKVVWNHN